MSTRTRSSKRGTATSVSKASGPDAIEAMILKGGLPIADVLPYKELDLLAIPNSSASVHARAHTLSMLPS